MDPITLIVSALAATAGGALGSVGEDAYEKIKTFIKSKLPNKQLANDLIDEFEKNPDDLQGHIVNQLRKQNVVPPEDIVVRAKNILKIMGDMYLVDIHDNETVNIHFHGHRYNGPPPQSDDDALRIYRQHLIHTNQHLNLRGINPEQSDSGATPKFLNLTSVYVALNTTSHEQDDRGKQSLDRSKEQAKPLPVLDLVRRQRHMALLGDPGSGKSTFINYLAHQLAQYALKPDDVLPELFKAWPKNTHTLVPIPVVLRDFARQLPKQTDKADPEHLWQFIVSRLKANNLDRAAGPLLKALDNGNAILLLDGLDEVPTPEQRTFVRDAVAAMIHRYPDCRCLITCRTLSYQDKQWQLNEHPDYPLDFHTHTLAPFNDDQIDGFISAWYNEQVRLKSD